METARTRIRPGNSTKSEYRKQISLCLHHASFVQHVTSLHSLFSLSVEWEQSASQPAHDVRTTLYGRWNDVKTLKRRCNDVVLTSCISWAFKSSKSLNIFRGGRETGKRGIGNLTNQISNPCQTDVLFIPLLGENNVIIIYLSLHAYYVIKIC